MTRTRRLQLTPVPTEDEMYEAIAARRTIAGVTFFVAVRTTGIYCRPGCPARTPFRKNVTFFASPEEAERAGFRACLRCKPREASRTDADAELVRRACRYVECAADETDVMPTAASLAEAMAVGAARLRAAFVQSAGMTPRQYIESVRVSRLKTALAGGKPATAAVYEAGFSSSSRVYEHASRRLGMTPATYARGGRGASIAYTVVDSSLGRVLIAGTARGICRVAFGAEDAHLERALHDEFPAAMELRRDDDALGAWAQEVLDRIEGRPASVDLPLDIRATAFQWRVWEELRRIPRGATRSYSEVAERIGNPAAIRAVANACAGNRVAVVIPCHRVNGKDGTLTGYRYGLDRKQALQQRERTPAAAAGKS
ncbi:MAG TPA: bifunctional DNA-binding transcriptional regulator/O6-methylguanine-DNA methyltransferase Ada [Dehalococcoidia bacterium]|nr:bifunctional DNA-binding transcriptional regulator/O6-methylguanine-DNA methyltransferase Ada [Dehalococcoidia bacterium]